MNQSSWRRYPATMSLLGVTIGVFLLMLVMRPSDNTSVRTIIDFGGMVSELVIADPDQIWRLVTPIFVHIGFEHLLFNMLALYFMGRQMEMVLGSWRFLAVYLLSGLMGNAASLFFDVRTVSAGASTSLFGMFAMMAVLYYVVRNPYLRAMSQSYLGLLIVNLIFTFWGSGISVSGHLGGAVGGALCAVMIPVPHEERIFSTGQRLLAWTAYLFLFALALSTLWR